MTKLYFKYGAMGSSKTAQALMTKFNYEEKGRTVWLIKPATDTRDDYRDEHGNLVTMIKSRIGLSCAADIIKKEDNIIDILINEILEMNIGAIICDEAQFLTTIQVEQLRKIVDNYDIPVMCFGLKTDFKTNLFEGSKRLLEIADSISEIKSICKCGNKAIINARINEKGKIITEGDVIELGSNEKYEGMCYFCWKNRIK